jgi:hypothetical protein
MAEKTSIGVGTGRGCITLMSLIEESGVSVVAFNVEWNFTCLQRFDTATNSTIAAFVTNDAVEVLTYESLNHRLATSSHSGQVRVFTVGECGKPN